MPLLNAKEFIVSRLSASQSANLREKGHLTAEGTLFDTVTFLSTSRFRARGYSLGPRMRYGDSLVGLYSNDLPALITATAAARYLGFSRQHFRSVVKRDPRLAACRREIRGSRARWSTKALRAWVDVPMAATRSRAEQVLDELLGGRGA
jgi:hypothetical protein